MSAHPLLIQPTCDRRPGTSLVWKSYDALWNNATDPRSRARLLAVATRESGAWLHALPVSSLGLRMEMMSSGLPLVSALVSFFATHIIVAIAGEWLMSWPHMVSVV